MRVAAESFFSSPLPATLDVLHAFTGGADGSHPWAGLIAGLQRQSLRDGGAWRGTRGLLWRGV